MTETETQSTETTTTFVSPTNNLVIVKKAGRRKPVGESGDFINEPGERFQFVDGRLTVTDQEDVDYLRSCTTFDQIFFEVGNEPNRPGENTAELHKVIMEAVFAGDYEKVADILVSERTSLSRPDVIAACEAALTKAGAAVPEKPSTPEHELSRVRLGHASGPAPGGEELVETTTASGSPAVAPAEPGPAPAA